MAKYTELWTLEKQRESNLKYRLNHPDKVRESWRKYRSSHKEERAEYDRIINVVTHAIRDGIINRPDTCSICGEVGALLHGHHDDYSKPLDVRWVCVQCHKDIHREVADDRQECSIG